MSYPSKKPQWALWLTVVLHALVWAFFNHLLLGATGQAPRAPDPVPVVLLPPAPSSPVEAPKHPQPAPDPILTPSAFKNPETSPAPQPPQASKAAPPAPTAEEWAFAAQYPLKNSKGYRYHWGQHVRSLMGTAVEGPDQGEVRFRIEIAPNGSLVKVETLWRTSDVAERLARQAIAQLPTLPSTPTGQALVFETTISFSPFASDNPPLYRDDCLPDPPVFRNPFAWDGQSPPIQAESPKVETPNPQSLADCLKLLPPDTIDAEMARDRRLMEQWGWSHSQR